MILDHKGKPIAKPISSVKCGSARIAMNKEIVEDWLEGVTKGDAAIGRGDHNWTKKPSKVFTQAQVDRLRSIGIAVYISPGQVIFADLTGPFPRVRQKRPLAERYVELVPASEVGNA